MRLSDLLCCELLSKVDIFDIRNNLSKKQYSGYSVVNCSQKLISLIFGTTHTCECIASRMLWIALKSWYLWYSEQRIADIHIPAIRCELLSKVDIFDIRNNFSITYPPKYLVVNCSQKLISLIFGTTKLSLLPWDTLLWIALKSWYLWYSEQLMASYSDW